MAQELAEGSQLTFKGTRPDGSTYQFPLNHTYNNNQINWFKAGSALNYMCAPPPSLPLRAPFAATRRAPHCRPRALSKLSGALRLEEERQQLTSASAGLQEGEPPVGDSQVCGAGLSTPVLGHQVLRCDRVRYLQPVLRNVPEYIRVLIRAWCSTWRYLSRLRLGPKALIPRSRVRACGRDYFAPRKARALLPSVALHKSSAQ